MKFLALTALLSVAVAQDEAAVGTLKEGESCADDTAACEAGLCCGEGINKDDMVEGEVTDEGL